jgi:lipopolysaccharide export LptBFGC system permease protein LptF
MIEEGGLPPHVAAIALSVAFACLAIIALAWKKKKGKP